MGHSLSASTGTPKQDRHGKSSWPRKFCVFAPPKAGSSGCSLPPSPSPLHLLYQEKKLQLFLSQAFQAIQATQATGSQELALFALHPCHRVPHLVWGGNPPFSLCVGEQEGGKSIPSNLIEIDLIFLASCYREARGGERQDASPRLPSLVSTAWVIGFLSLECLAA